MKYSFLPYKIVHFDPIKPLIGQGLLNAKTYVRYEIYPVSPNKELPVLFRWTFRISKNAKNLFSCVGEGKYLLKFELGENPDKDLNNLIATSLINLEMRWEDETRSTPLFGQTIPDATDNEKKMIKDSIIQMAKEKGLL